MSSQKTAHYRLHAWEPADSFLRAEFNENFSAIDAALAALEGGKCRMTVGSCTGDGAASQHIELGFTPKAVLLEHPMGLRPAGAGYTSYGGLAVTGQPLTKGAPMLEIEPGGFRIYYSAAEYGCTLNGPNQTWQYIAFA